jgi:hypothetical protein
MIGMVSGVDRIRRSIRLEQSSYPHTLSCTQFFLVLFAVVLLGSALEIRHLLVFRVRSHLHYKSIRVSRLVESVGLA